MQFVGREEGVVERWGRIVRAPENFLDPAQIAEVTAGRRDFLRGALIEAAGAGVAASLPARASVESPGDPSAARWPRPAGRPDRKAGGWLHRPRMALQSRDQASSGGARISARGRSLAGLAAKHGDHSRLRPGDHLGEQERQQNLLLHRIRGRRAGPPQRSA